MKTKLVGKSDSHLIKVDVVPASEQEIKEEVVSEKLPQQEPRLRQGMALADNTQILKVINMNKMQHQYIQNLQKANMTLKCKIKEVTEIHSDLDMQRYHEEQASAPQTSDEEEVPEEEFELEELGTIEEVSYRQAMAEKRARERKRSFYDRNSISKTRPRDERKKHSRHREYREVVDLAERNFYDKPSAHP